MYDTLRATRPTANEKLWCGRECVSWSSVAAVAAQGFDLGLSAFVFARWIRSLSRFRTDNVQTILARTLMRYYAGLKAGT